MGSRMVWPAISIGVCLTVSVLAQNLRAWEAVGSQLSPWTPGTLDIHQISTGRGNSALMVFPDGTTLLVDIGGAEGGVPETEPHLAGAPNPGAAIGRYIERHISKAKLDYALITHFHPDHMGAIADEYKEVPFAMLLDRGWPDYSYPAPRERALAGTIAHSRSRVGLRLRDSGRA